jgi:Flp pilus assembly protein CpaB
MVSSRGRAPSLLGTVPSLAGWPRRLAALLCLTLAVLSALTSLHSPSSAQSEARIQVVLTTHSLPAGTVLTRADLKLVQWPASWVPPDALASTDAALGRPIGAAMSAREPLTAKRMLDGSITGSLKPRQVALSITLPDVGQAAILSAGAMIDLWAANDAPVIADGKPVSGGALGREIATAVRVLVVVPPSERASATGLTVVLAVDRTAASRLANQPSGTLLATLRPDS